MRPELEQSLRNSEFGKYLIEAAKADASIEEALEQGFQESVMQERKRQLRIARVGSESAPEVANLLSDALVRTRQNHSLY
jgi:hypothetical protein